MFKERKLKTLKMTSVCLFETLVNIYQTTRLSQLRKAQPRQSLHGNN